MQWAGYSINSRISFSIQCVASHSHRFLFNMYFLLQPYGIVTSAPTIRILQLKVVILNNEMSDMEKTKVMCLFTRKHLYTIDWYMVLLWFFFSL